MKTEIAIIILNYNSSSYTIDCINSINSFSAVSNYKIIIYDNGSEIEDYNKLLSITDNKILLKRNENNLGFASGNMEAVKDIEADYYFFLNNDTLFLNNVIDPLFTFAESNKNVGICAPQLYNLDNTIHSTFDYFPTLETKIFGISLVKFFSKRTFPKKDLVRTDPLKVELVSGSAMFVRKTHFDFINGFDKTFFLYCEEEDLALKMQKSNFDVFLVPQAKVKHIGGGSTGRKFILEKEFYISFNYFYKKHYGTIKAFIMRLFMFIKIGKKFKRNKTNWELAKFILSNPDVNKSMRFLKK